MLKYIFLVVIIFQMLGCSWLTDDDGIFRDRKKDYRKVADTPRIEVPEEFDEQAIIDLYPVPPLSIYADEGFIDDHPLPSSALNRLEENVKIHKVGNNRWILLQSSPSLVWPRLNEYLNTKGFTISLENGGLGVVEASKDGKIYRFKIEQGFQRNSAEVYIRHVESKSVNEGFWPAVSKDQALEFSMTDQLAQFFADASDRPAYSFAAQGISTNKKVVVNHNQQGRKVLTLYVDKNRALASLQKALTRADFGIEDYDEGKQSFDVQYRPQVPEGKKPGFWARLFGKKAKEFDEDVENAGKHYRLSLVAIKGNRFVVTIGKLDKEKTNKKKLNRELNKMILLIKGHLV